MRPHAARRRACASEGDRPKPAISVESVGSYRGRLMEKLGLTSRGEIVRFTLHQGWLNEEWSADTF